MFLPQSMLNSILTALDAGELEPQPVQPVQPVKPTHRGQRGRGGTLRAFKRSAPRRNLSRDSTQFSKEDLTVLIQAASTSKSRAKGTPGMWLSKGELRSLIERYGV